MLLSSNVYSFPLLMVPKLVKAYFDLFKKYTDVLSSLLSGVRTERNPNFMLVPCALHAEKFKIFWCPDCRLAASIAVFSGAHFRRKPSNASP